jgi:hypothetical protein
MKYRTILVCSLLGAFATASSAQLIDLDAVSGSPFAPRERIYLGAVSGARIDLDAMPERKVVFARVSFVGGDGSRCPEDSGQLQISGGVLGQTRMALPADPGGQGSSNGWRSTLNPVDEETYQYRVALPDCRTDVAIRHQVRLDGAWTTLPVRRELRLGVLVEERRELERQRLERVRQRAESNRESYRASLSRTLGEARAKELSDLYAARQAAMAARLRKPDHEVLTARQAFFFDDTAPTCFNGIGNYRVERTGVIFSFLVPPEVIFVPSPPGAVNRFLIERTDLGESRSRLYFERGDCRWELTIGQSVLRDGEWFALPLAPSPPPKG